MQKTNTNEIEAPLCTQNHSENFIYLCKRCANSNLPIGKIFFCYKCDPNSLNSHISHMTERFTLSNQKFLNPYNEFK